MKCNCITEVQSQTIEAIQNSHPSWNIEKINQFDGTGIQPCSYSLNSGYIARFDFKVRYTFEKVNGEISQPKTYTVSLMPTFCPFCGTKFDN